MALSMKVHIRAMNKLDTKTRAQILADWIRIHKSLRVTPAMAAGLSATLMTWEDIVEAMDADRPSKKCGPYKKQGDEISN